MRDHTKSAIAPCSRIMRTRILSHYDPVKLSKRKQKGTPKEPAMVILVIYTERG